MSNISKAFEHGKAFIPFVTCGDPSLDVTEEVVYAMVEAGADLIELGIPFSDPTAEGPVIQGANIRALAGGVTTDKVFDLVRKLRKKVTIPMVFMTYANVVFSYGSERFISTCREIGIDGLILPDIPYEEKDEFDGICKQYDVDLISLIAPTSHERISMIANDASGFVYCVSSLGAEGRNLQRGEDLRLQAWNRDRRSDRQVRGGGASKVQHDILSACGWRMVPCETFRHRAEDQVLSRGKGKLTGGCGRAA